MNLAWSCARTGFSRALRDGQFIGFGLSPTNEAVVGDFYSGQMRVYERFRGDDVVAL